MNREIDPFWQSLPHQIEEYGGVCREKSGDFRVSLVEIQLVCVLDNGPTQAIGVHIQVGAGGSPTGKREAQTFFLIVTHFRGKEGPTGITKKKFKLFFSILLTHEGSHRGRSTRIYNLA